MKTFPCACGNRLFFDNTACTSCGRVVGYWHPVRAVVPLESAVVVDGWPDWQVHASARPALTTKRFVMDQNRTRFGVGNEIVVWDPDDPEAAPQQPLAVTGRLNGTIPDLSQPLMLAFWSELEAAKRRLLYTVAQLGIPYGIDAGDPLPLRFEFLADPPSGPAVSTGHANGTITINVAEADPVERERLRVSLGEPQRTLIGHLRHEFAHYTWQRLVLGRDEANFVARFGDHNNPDYATAHAMYYQHGPPANWRSQFVSAYAAMHPWEDFAETFACFLDMHDTLETAHHFGFSKLDPRSPRSAGSELDALLREYARLGVAVNELNRGMGLLDLVPEILVQPVVDKLHYIAGVIGAHAR